VTAAIGAGARMRYAISDTMLLTWRNLIHYVRVPQYIAFAVVQPIMFTVLFAFVFGGAIQTGGSYVDYLIPGIIVQTVIFGSMQSGINIAEDMQKGIMDRFRSLPIARGTVLAARTLSDTFRHFLTIFIMLAVGYAIGYRFHGSALDAVEMVLFCVLVGLAFSWIAATIGLLVKDTQTAEIAGFTWVFPVVFLSSIFVPTRTMLDWLKPIAENNPVTLAANATRGWSFGQPALHDATVAAVWMVGIIAVFSTIAVWRFRRLA
jgi:ABC-2 type transport system permease protein/oleandomycin transport system permease protein